MKSAYLAAASWLLVPLALFACDSGDDATDSSGAIDREAILGDIEEIRELLGSLDLGFDPEQIEGADYSDGTLTLNLAANAPVQGAEQMEDLCRDVSEAISLSDIAIVIEGPGSSAQCSLQRQSQ